MKRILLLFLFVYQVNASPLIYPPGEYTDDPNFPLTQPDRMPNNGHTSNYTFGVDERPVIKAKETRKGLVTGQLYKIHIANTNTGNMRIFDLNGVQIGWIGERRVLWEVQKLDTATDPNAILLFNTDDIGREIEFLTGDLTGEKTQIRRLPQLDPSDINYAGIGVFPIANTYIGSDIHYLDVGVEWRWVTFNDDHPNTGVYNRSYFQIAGTPTGVRVVIELKVTWDLRFYHGTQQYGPLWEERNVYPYPAQTSADSTVLRTELGRIWGWDDWKPALNNDYYTYRIRTVIIPERMEDNYVYFTSPDGTDFDRLTLLDSNEGVFLKRRFERLYQGGHTVRPTALLVLDKQIWTKDPDDGNRIKLVGGLVTEKIPFIFNCNWGYDGSKLL